MHMSCTGCNLPARAGGKCSEAEEQRCGERVRVFIELSCCRNLRSGKTEIE